jgi:glycosyltransferase involved in cell wall biosynthesis
MQVSLIIPVFNPGASINSTFEAIKRFQAASGLELEIVFVDDASTDGSIASLDAIAGSEPNIVVAKHDFNRGQAAAVLTGISLARGEIVVTFDDDLRYRPEEIPDLLSRIATAGPDDIVMGVYVSGRKPFWRMVAAIGANAISNLFLRKPIPLGMTTFSAFRPHLCSHLGLDGSHDRALFTELVQVADGTHVVPLKPQSATELPSRYTLVSLWRLFMSRSRCYRPSRVLFALAGCLFAAFASGVWLTMQTSWQAGLAAVFLIAFAAASWLLAMLLISMRRGSQALRSPAANPARS